MARHNGSLTDKEKEYKRNWYQNNPKRFKKYRWASSEGRKKYRQTNKAKIQAYNLQHKLKISYGLTLDEYNLLLEVQNGCCAICNNLPGKRRLAVDHDHETGKVRGLLCGRCNTALGNLKENLTILENMGNYIKKHNGI